MRLTPRINGQSASSAAGFITLFALVWLIVGVTAAFLPGWVTLIFCLAFLGWLAFDQYTALERRRISYEIDCQERDRMLAESPEAATWWNEQVAKAEETEGEAA